MKLSQLAVLLPCRSLEDFPLRRTADEAEQLLSAWSALWHPTLIGDARCVPTWFPAEEPPQDPAGHLMILPGCSEGLLPDDWLDTAEQEGACVLRGYRDRDEMVAAALTALDAMPDKGDPGSVDPGSDDPGSVDPRDVDPKLVDDFLALGFCHFLVELLTRQLRYMSNLDEETFRTEVVAAAEEALHGDGEAARARLQAAFDLLHEAREYFYPVEAHLLDLTLVAPATLGPSLRAELAGDVPTNLLVSGEMIRLMARQEPETLAMLAEALEQNKAALIGGEFDEGPLPLLTPEAVRHGILKGLDAYQEHLGRRPTVFGRRRFGLSAVLPQILDRLGFVAAMHCTLDDGRFPTGNQSRIQWEGIDSTVLEAMARVPIDVRRADAFLRLPEKLGDAMDLDHVATVVLAHWPGQSSRWYADLKRIAAYSSVIGTFTTIDDYFTQTGMAGQQKQYGPDQYRPPYLKQAVVAGQHDPISRWVRYFRRRAEVEAVEALDTLATLVAGGSTTADAPKAPPVVEKSVVEKSAVEKLVAEVEDSLAADSDTAGELDRRLEHALDEAAARFGRSLTGPDRPGERGFPGERGSLVVNPSSFSRRQCLAMPHLTQSPRVAGAVRAVGDWDRDRSVVVDVPPMGFAWVGPPSDDDLPVEPAPRKTRRGKKPKKEPPLAEQLDEEHVLRNEFFKIVIDRYTGAVRAISDYYSRGVRLAQQIALRMPERSRDKLGDDSEYSIMAADDISVTSSGPVLGEIVCRGRLVDRRGGRVAKFVQTTRVRRGSRVIELLVDLDVGRVPEPNPWNSYYAVRFAWGDATANVYRSVSLANRPTDAVQLDAPHFIDVRAGKVRTTLLCGGLPYHRRFGLRKLDTLLVVRGETARSFRLGIGIDLPHPVHGALDFLAPQTMLSGVHAPPVPSGWLFHLDCRNVTATHWEPLFADGRVGGFRVRLLETDGRKVQLALRSFRPLASAQKIKPGDKPPDELAVEGDRVAIDFGPHEWVEMEARFAK